MPSLTEAFFTSSATSKFTKTHDETIMRKRAKRRIDAKYGPSHQNFRRSWAKAAASINSSNGGETDGSDLKPQSTLSESHLTVSGRIFLCWAYRLQPSAAVSTVGPAPTKDMVQKSLDPVCHGMFNRIISFIAVPFLHHLRQPQWQSQIFFFWENCIGPLSPIRRDRQILRPSSAESHFEASFSFRPCH